MSWWMGFGCGVLVTVALGAAFGIVYYFMSLISGIMRGGR